ncbi:MAG: hypothetical protein LBH98_02785 [Chitinispirillales bacterium]|jgi:hypothetical protein|nr:hypothetical protein [Chitinispirillales bacterium]
MKKFISLAVFAILLLEGCGSDYGSDCKCSNHGSDCKCEDNNNENTFPSEVERYDISETSNIYGNVTKQADGSFNIVVQDISVKANGAIILQVNHSEILANTAYSVQPISGFGYAWVVLPGAVSNGKIYIHIWILGTSGNLNGTIKMATKNL